MGLLVQPLVDRHLVLTCSEDKSNGNKRLQTHSEHEQAGVSQAASYWSAQTSPGL